MNLPQETKSFAVWLARVMRQFLRVRPGTTFTVICASALYQITTVLVFFLPLKVILLVGADGVPRYFPFADPAAKNTWVVGLSIAAFAAYGLTLVLDAISSRLGGVASIDVLQGANEMTVLSMQDQMAKNAYTTICQFFASCLFVGACAVALLIINQSLLAFIAVMTAAQYLFTAYIMRGDDVEPGAVKAWVGDNRRDYLKICASINFLGGFLVILAPFLVGREGNILLALLGIIITRQAMGTLVSAVKDALELQRSRDRINALVFRKAHLRKSSEEQQERALRLLFNKTGRQRRTTEILRQSAGLREEPEVCWADSTIRRAAMLLIVEAAPGKRRFQQQIFPDRQAYRLANEEFLFRYVPRRRLYAPEVVARFRQGPFECQICEHGTGQSPSRDTWENIEHDLLTALWRFPPPKRLIAAYRTSHPLPNERLTETLVGRLSVAVDTTEDQACLDRLQSVLPVLRERLRNLPLVVHNPDLTLANVVENGTGGYVVMTWTRWSLEYLGAGLNTNRSRTLLEVLPALRGQRKDVAEYFDAQDVQLAGLCHELETEISQRRYKTGLETGARILANPRLADAVQVA